MNKQPSFWSPRHLQAILKRQPLGLRMQRFGWIGGSLAFWINLLGHSLSAVAVPTPISNTPFERYDGSIDYTVTSKSLSSAVAPCPIAPSGTSTLTVPAGATVKKAYLYWSGAGTNPGASPFNTGNANGGIDNQVTFQGPIGAATTVTAIQTWEDQAPFTFGGINYKTYYYGARADVTSLVTGSGNYTIGGIRSLPANAINNTIPPTTYCGAFAQTAGWVLVVIYEKTGLPNKTLALYEGFKVLTPGGGSATVNLSGFQASSNSVISKTTPLVWQGDNSLVGDTLSINGVSFGDNNVFNSSGTTKPAGSEHAVDADLLNISPFVSPGSTSLSLAFGTTGNDLLVLQALVIDLTTNPDISGKVWNDANGSANGTFIGINDGAEVGSNAVSLNAILVDSAGKVIASTPVNADGTYTFKSINPGQTNVTIRLATSAGTVGSSAPVASLPANWINTSPLTTNPFTTSAFTLTGQDFGIEQLPNTTDLNPTSQTNPGGTTTVQVPTLAGTDPEDGLLGSGKTFKIVTLPTNGTLYYNGATVTAGQTIANYDATKLTIDPNDGTITVSFIYAAIDAAGKDDPTPATVTIPFTTLPALSLSGTVFEDPNYGGGAGRPLNTPTTSPQQNARVELYDASGAFKGFTTTDVNGLYTFNASNVTGGVVAGNYKVRVVNSTVTSSRPGYVNTLLPVQTFRTDASIGSVTAVTDRVGGEKPLEVDAAANTTDANLSTLDTATQEVQSITTVQVGSTPVTGIDFGFNFDTIVNTNTTGQGSLSQFIINSNTLTNAGLDQVANPSPSPGTTAINPASGVETSIFMIPSSQLTGGVAVILPTTLLPAFTDTFTILDGRTQTANIGDSNSGLLGIGGTVGTGADGRAGTGDEATLSQVSAPEIEIRDGGNLATGLQLQANNITIQGIAIHGFGATQAAGQGDIYVAGVNNISITQNVIGARATSFTNPTAAERTGGSGVWVTNGAQVTIDNNLIGYTGYNGIACTNQSLTSSAVVNITNNEFRGNAAVNNISNAIELFWNGTNPTIKIQGNLLADTVNQGAIHFQNNLGGTGATLNIDNNTITNTNSTLAYTQAIALNLIQDAIISHNIIENTNNTTLGVGIGIQSFPINGSPGNIPARRNRITKNAIYDTLKGPGIDLWTQGQSGATPRITANDGLKNPTQANEGMDYPIITSSILTSGTLTVNGFVGNTPAGSPTFAGATLEFFIADNSPADQNGEAIVGDGKSLAHGEGRTYIGTCIADASSKFNCSFPNIGTLGLTDAKNITATATDPQGNTSEFSAVPIASDPNIFLVKRITQINGNTTSHNGDDLAKYIDDPVNAYDDNTITIPTQPTPADPRKDTDKWPALNTFMLGGINGGNVKPNDELEYTIYFLSAGEGEANNVLICDRVPENATFIPTAFNSFATKNITGLPGGDRGIIWQNNGEIESLTNVSDGDTAEYLSPGIDPTIKYPGIKCDGSNTNGVVVVKLGNVPNATAPSTPINSYGFIRFRGRVK